MDPKNVVLAGQHAPLPEAVRILGLTYEVRRKRLPDGEDGYIVPCSQRAYNQHRRSGSFVTPARHAAWQQATGVIERSLKEKVAELSGSGTIYHSRNHCYDVVR